MLLRLLIASVVSLSMFLQYPALAQDAAPANVEEVTSEATVDAAQVSGGQSIETAAKQMVLIDIDTDTVLASKDADSRMYPSSMTKLLTQYVVYSRLKEGSIKLTDSFTVSERAWRMQGSKMFVPIGGEIPLEDLIRGIAIQSGNDACVVVAEGLAGSEEQFATVMNDTAKKIGMVSSNFVNASGWPDENHYTTARDLAVLGERIILDFPEYHHYSSEREFTYNNIRQANRNPLLGRTDLGVDGLKTGHTEIAGYGIVLSAVEPGTNRRLILVINGLDSEKARAEEGAKMLTYGFKQFENKKLITANQPVTNIPVWLGKQESVAVGVASDAVVTLPRLGRESLQFKAQYSTPLNAPVAAGQEVGTLAVTLPNGETKSYPLVTLAAVEQKSAFARIPAVIGHWLGL
ncbi:MAG: D-alanyl-D-alanine carboxypeptidase [Alphaproteobacteria bacterium]|nr:D-alanyl-D-alanine carboxypeptidase [Alphaproteobacteria bacterium]